MRFRGGSKSDPLALERRQRFERDGYLVLGGFVDSQSCDRVVAEADRFYAAKGVAAERADRTMNLHHAAPEARKILLGGDIGTVISGVLGARAVFFQSIYFNAGSQQAPHSDYMFMSTEPPDQLVGFWLACEDVADDAGPLVYYPGSHKLATVGIPEYYAAQGDRIHDAIDSRREELEARLGGHMEASGQSLLTSYLYECWVNDLHRSVAEAGIEPRRFAARKGDVLLWHARLVHGGTPVDTPGKTRRSLVAHYMSDSMRRLYEMNWIDSKRPLSLRQVRRRIKASGEPDLFVKP